MSFVSLHSFYSITSALNGTVFGSLLFAGFVDCRTLLQLVSEKELDANVAKALAVGFSWWWPNGAKLMIPLIVSGIVCNAYAYFKSNQWPWLLSAGSHLSIGVWTSLVMGGPIKSLLLASNLKLLPSALRESIFLFSFLHFIRIVFAAVAVFSGTAALLSSVRN